MYLTSLVGRRRTQAYPPQTGMLYGVMTRIFEGQECTAPSSTLCLDPNNIPFSHSTEDAGFEPARAWLSLTMLQTETSSGPGRI